MFKIKNIAVVFVTLLLCLLAVHTPSFTAARADESMTDCNSFNTQTDFTPITATSSDVTTEEMYVYDGDNNKLYYNRVTGMVFSMAGVVYNNDSQPLTYDDKADVFEDSLKRRLDLVERSTSGLQNYYLMFEDYHVSSINVNSDLFIVGIAANTKFNSGKAYDMLVTRKKVTINWFERYILGRRDYYVYYDLHSHKIDDKYFEQTKTSGFLLAGAGTSMFAGSVFTKFEKWGTILDLLDEIVYLMELVPPTGSPLGEFALNTATGAYLRDDRGQKIRIAENGQLIDPMSWPLIGADARPLWWREDLRAYVDYNGKLLVYDNTENILKDGNGFIAHSVISNVIAGMSIALVYLADGVTLLPVTTKLISIKPATVEYYDLNGKKITPSEITAPTWDEEDLRAEWPEEFLSWWDQLKVFFNSVVSFFKQWGLLILIGLVILITSPLWIQLLTWIIPPLIGGIAKGIVALFKGLVFLFTLPVKLFKRDS